MENNFDFRNTLLHFLRGDKRLINNLNFFYVQNQSEFMAYIIKQKLENIFCEKIKEYGIERNSIVFLSRIERNQAKIEKENILKVKTGIYFINFLRNKGIKITPYKGFAYSFLAYKNPYARNMADLDFLLEKPEDIYKIFDLIKNNKDFAIEDWEQPTKEDIYWKMKENQELTVLYKNLTFEIHGAIKDQFYFFPRANYPWWEGQGEERLFLDGENLVIPRKEIFFLEIICHNTTHEWESLNMSFDLYYFLKNNILDWEFIIAKAKSLGFMNILIEGLLYMQKTTGIELALNLEKLKKNKIILKTVEKMEKRDLYYEKSYVEKLPLKLFIGKTITSAKEKDTFSDNVFTIFHYFFVPTARNYKLLKLPRSLYFVYYIFNPFFMIYARIKSLVETRQEANSRKERKKI